MEDQILKVEVRKESNKIIIYYKQDNSHLMSNPPPPPYYYREIYTFKDLTSMEKEYAKVERKEEIIKWKDD